MLYRMWHMIHSIWYIVNDTEYIYIDMCMYVYAYMVCSIYIYIECMVYNPNSASKAHDKGASRNQEMCRIPMVMCSFWAPIHVQQKQLLDSC